MVTALIDLQYLPNVNWMANFMAFDKLIIEQHENFIKSTYRNRCEIAGAGGKLTLTIPVAGGRDHHQKYGATKIDKTKSWQHAHWQSIIAAYGSSPFFDFYADKLEPFYNRPFELLFDFNIQLLKTLMQMLKAKKEFEFTSVYEKMPMGVIDLRSTRQSMLNPVINHQRYYQVFEDRNGFMPNLSVLDLIFNEVPVAMSYIQRLIDAKADPLIP
jgi:hypothetical protein